MKKIFTTLLITITVNAHAQKKLPFIFRLELQNSNVKKNDPSVPKASPLLNIGAGAEIIIPLAKSKDDDKSGFALNPALSYLQTGYKPQTNDFLYIAKVNYASLQLPITYYLADDRFSIYAGVGPYLNYALSGKYNVNAIDPYTKFKFGNSTNDDRKKIDEGILIKVGIINKRFLLGFQKNIGIVDLTPNDSKATAKSYLRVKSFELHVGYYFN
jgi:hypothetical protein